MLLPQRKIVRAPQFMRAMDELGMDCAEPQLDDLEWKLSRGYSLRNHEEVPTKSGRPAFLIRTNGVGDCPPLRLLIVLDDARGEIIFADASFATTGSTNN